MRTEEELEKGCQRATLALAGESNSQAHVIEKGWCMSRYGPKSKKQRTMMEREVTHAHRHIGEGSERMEVVAGLRGDPDQDDDQKKMEDPQPLSTDICIGQKLVVTVEDANPDLLLVSYEHGTRLFQGVLLDSTKGRVPCGVYPPGGQFPPPPPTDAAQPLEGEDKLFSVRQRHTYFQQDTMAPGDPGAKAKKGLQLRQSISLTQRFKNSRMTVRLRPRQVLCSKCQSICNEKSENVSGAKGQRATEPPAAAKPVAEPRSRSLRDRNSQEHQAASSSKKSADRRLVPKLVKLKPSEIEAATNKGVSCLRKNSGSRNSRNNCDAEVEDGEVVVGTAAAYSVSGTDLAPDGRVPKLKLYTNLCLSDSSDTKRKGRIPKMTISLPPSESSKEFVENESGEVKNQGIPKMILSTVGRVGESGGEKKDKEGSSKNRKLNESSESQMDSKELRLRSGNVHKLTISAAAAHQEFGESAEDRVSSLPKLTILPVVPKKDEQEEMEGGDAKHHKLGKFSMDDLQPEKMSLRKKRSLGSMEDLWDESVFDEASKKHKREETEGGGAERDDSQCQMTGEDKEGPEEDKRKATPVLKISFGPEGKGTVLKIPSKSTVVTINTSEGDTEEEMNKKYKDMSAKAAKKALKKAKKEAQKKTVLGGASPAYMVGGISPRFGGMSPLRLGGMSPARLGGFSPARFGGTSPARFGGMSPARAAAVDLSTRDLPPKKHKHKVKHKKKHKDERRHKSPDEMKDQVEVQDEQKDTVVLDSADADIPVENITPELQWNSSERAEYPATTSPHGLNHPPIVNSQAAVASPGIPLQPSRHKLSISIKRVSNASYVACDSSHSDGERTSTPTNLMHFSEEEPTDKPHEADGFQDPTLTLTTETDEYGKLAPLEMPESYKVEGARLDHPALEAQDEQNQQLLPTSFGMETPEPSLPGSDSPSSDDTCNGAIPDFPSSAPNIGGMEEEQSAALLMKLSWKEVDRCEVDKGRVMAVGDVVWGKIHGFPWWPAKVMAIRVLRERNGDAQCQQAHVSWYGSSTSSLMPANTLQPFLQMFKMRYNKKKRGPYREAIKQATSEAEQTPASDLQHPEVVAGEQQQHQAPENLLGASPREVDVVS
ncbi:uncharacterized protein LOC135089040 [Scylla paramamosain]|uniref:uncharacterized protein LOC135089040 n=1 Tax=Scylla paramamosain TaxID=85552 RepID=UPI003082D8A2